jgi:ribonuclease VapC
VSAKTTKADRSRFVLDSYALLVHFQREPGGEAVRDVLVDAVDGRAELYLSTVNLGEIAYIAERERGLPAAEMSLAAIDQLPIRIVDPNRRRVLEAAHLKAHYPIAYADAFAAALAIEFDAALVTGDPEFRAVESIVEVMWLSRA